MEIDINLLLALALIGARIAVAIVEKRESNQLKKMEKTNIKRYLIFALLRVASNIVHELLKRQEADFADRPSVTVKPAKR